MSKPKTFRPWNPEQTLLLPPSPVEWLPANHLVFFLLDLAARARPSALKDVAALRAFASEAALKAEIERWAPIIKKAGAYAD